MASTADRPDADPGDRLIVAISSRALFDLGESHALFENEGLDAYREFQMSRENDLLAHVLREAHAAALASAHNGRHGGPADRQ